MQGRWIEKLSTNVLFAEEDVPQRTNNKWHLHLTYAGVDMFGQLLTKQGRTTPKRSGCIFTCMTTRAVHLVVRNKVERNKVGLWY